MTPLRPLIVALLLLASPPVYASTGGCADGMCPIPGAIRQAPIQRRGMQPIEPAVRITCSLNGTSMHTTGTLIAGGWVVSCAHGLRTGWDVQLTFTNGQRVKPTEVHIDGGNDMAIFKVGRVPGIRSITTQSVPPAGTKVLFGGFGPGTYLQSAGTVKSIEQDFVVFDGGQRIRHGDSGGPVFVPRGGLVAIISEVSSNGRISEVRGCSIDRILAFVAEHSRKAPESQEQKQSAKEPDEEAGRNPVEDQPVPKEPSVDQPVPKKPQVVQEAPPKQPQQDSAASVIGGAATAASNLVAAGSSISAWTAVAAALGVSGPVGIGIGFAGWFISRRIKSRLQEDPPTYRIDMDPCPQQDTGALDDLYDQLKDCRDEKAAKDREIARLKRSLSDGASSDEVKSLRQQLHDARQSVADLEQRQRELVIAYQDSYREAVDLAEAELHKKDPRLWQSFIPRWRAMVEQFHSSVREERKDASNSPVYQ
jgi:hypothetical protein